VVEASETSLAFAELAVVGTVGNRFVRKEEEMLGVS